MLIGGRCRQGRPPLILYVGVGRIRLGGGEIGPGLGNFLRTAAVAKFHHHGALRGDSRIGFPYLRRQAVGIEPCQHLALFDDVAFLDQYAGYTLRAIEGEGGLPQIDIAVKRQRVIAGRPVHIPPCSAANRGEGKKENDYSKRLAHFTNIALQT